MTGVFRLWLNPQEASEPSGRESIHQDMKQDIKANVDFQQLVDCLDSLQSAPRRVDVGNHGQSPIMIRERLRSFTKQLEEGGDDQSTLSKPDARESIIQILASDVLARLVSILRWLDFEAQKLAMRAFGAVLRLGALSGCDVQLAEYLLQRRADTCQALLAGCGDPEVFSYCANMLRSCMKYPKLVEGLLWNFGAATCFIDLASHQSFDIASEAFSCLRDLLLLHPDVSALYLQKNFNELFVPFHGLLLDGDNYVTQRQALRLLAEILLNRSFLQVMTKYVENDNFLQIHMNLLRNNSTSIRIEAFHVFKIFVANPNKPPVVQKILRKNAERLLTLLEMLDGKKQDNDKNSRAFHEDMQVVCERLRQM